MRIPDLNNSDTLLANLQRLSSRQSTLSDQIATGQRIKTASDDPAAAGRILSMQEEKQRLQQYTKNGNTAIEISQTTYASISDLKTISDRAGELGVLGVGVTDPTAYSAYSTELNQLIEQGLSTVNGTHAGAYIFGGTKTDAAPFTATRDASGQITGVTYNGSASTAEFHVGENEKVSPYTAPATNQQFADFLNHLVTMRDALASGSSSAVQAAQPNLRTSEDNILQSVGDLAATQTRLEGGLTQNEARFSDLESSTSKEADADISQTVVKLTQAQTAYQAALQVGAQVLRVSLLDYVR